MAAANDKLNAAKARLAKSTSQLQEAKARYEANVMQPEVMARQLKLLSLPTFYTYLHILATIHSTRLANSKPAR